MKLTGSGDKLCGPPIHPISGSSPTHCQSICLSRLYLLKVPMEISSLHLPFLWYSGLLACLPFQALFTESSRRDQLLAPLPFSGALRASHPLCCVFLFSSLFIIQFFFCGVGSQSIQGAMLVYPKGGCGTTTCCLFAYLLVCWMSPKQVWSQCLVVWSPPVFSV
jgi:hypothetical protein